MNYLERNLYYVWIFFTAFFCLINAGNHFESSKLNDEVKDFEDWLKLKVQKHEVVLVNKSIPNVSSEADEISSSDFQNSDLEKNSNERILSRQENIKGEKNFAAELFDPKTEDDSERFFKQNSDTSPKRTENRQKNRRKKFDKSIPSISSEEDEISSSDFKDSNLERNSNERILFYRENIKGEKNFAEESFADGVSERLPKQNSDSNAKRTKNKKKKKRKKFNQKSNKNKNVLLENNGTEHLSSEHSVKNKDDSVEEILYIRRGHGSSDSVPNILKDLVRNDPKISNYQEFTETGHESLSNENECLSAYSQYTDKLCSPSAKYSVQFYNSTKISENLRSDMLDKIPPRDPKDSMCDFAKDLGSERNVNERAMCPFKWELSNRNPDRIPEYLFVAACSCQISRSGFHQSMCIPLTTKIRVLWRTECTERTFVYQEGWEEIAVACVPLDFTEIQSRPAQGLVVDSPQ